jgi:DNA-directed RNA polymerase specialized sigma24 family protein
VTEVDEHEWLAKRFEENRTHLRAVAHRKLGSMSEADDATQEAWLHLSRSDTSGVEIDNLEAWLLTVVERVALNMLRSRKRRGATRRTPAGPDRRPPRRHRPRARGVALRLLRPRAARRARGADACRRLAYVLHDMFSVPFDEIGHILERSPDAARQLASRGRRRARWRLRRSRRCARFRHRGPRGHGQRDHRRAISGFSKSRCGTSRGARRDRRQKIGWPVGVCPANQPFPVARSAGLEPAAF